MQAGIGHRTDRQRGDPPGHDAWVDGNEGFVGIEMMSADVYAKPGG